MNVKCKDTSPIRPIPNLLQASEDPGGAGSTYAKNHRDELLAMTIPAITWAVGKNEVSSLVGPEGNRNIDMMSEFETGWPTPGVRNNNDWRHGDYRIVAYPYVYKLFDDIVTKGNLKE